MSSFFMTIPFKDLSLSPDLLKAIEKLGFTHPTEIQAKAIPMLLQSEKVDFLGQAQTGTGKTLAFGIPLLEKIDKNIRAPQALIVAPTRELVVQITQSIEQLAAPLGISIEAVYGGVSLGSQIGALKRGVQIVVGTPGRLNDHLERRTLSLQQVSTLVLDEADIMLDMGFKEEVDQILSSTPRDRQIWLFSATVKPGIAQIMREHMKNTVTVKATPAQPGTAKTKQYYVVAPMRDRLTALCRFIDTTPDLYAFIFCQTKALTADVAQALSLMGYPAQALHGDMSQAQRNHVIKQFKNKDFRILVATDVAARGIDVVDLTHVINYSLPQDQESYVHRIGRTGRAGKEGIAITLISQGDVRRIAMIERKFNFQIKPIPVPSVQDIAQIYLARATEYAATLIHHHANTKEAAYITQLRELMGEYNHQELVNAFTSLLASKFFTTLSEKPREISMSSHSSDDQERRGRGSRDGGRRRFGGGDRSRFRGGDRGGSRGGDSRGGERRSEGKRDWRS